MYKIMYKLVGTLEKEPIVKAEYKDRQVALRKTLNYILKGMKLKGYHIFKLLVEDMIGGFSISISYLDATGEEPFDVEYTLVEV